MKNFVKAINSPLSKDFQQEYDIALDKDNGTNTCSLVFESSDGPIFNIVRHAHSCDNRNMGKGGFKGTMARLGDSGIYASLSLWGILSTLKFSNEKLQELITAQQIENPPGLKICRGMVKETPEYLKDSYDSMNMLCGEQRDRMPIGNFSLSLGHCGTKEGELGITLDKNCIRIITDPNGPKVVLYLDKKTNVIQARFFQSAVTSTTYDSKIKLSTKSLDEQLNSIVSHFFSSLVDFDNNELVSYLKSELIESIKNFIKSDTEIDPAWKKILEPLYKSYINKKFENLSKESTPAYSYDLGQPVSVTAGGTNKRTRRHRKHKVMKKYTRKNKKYNPRRKSRRIQKRKQTYKRKSRKSRKSRK
jgi:hypothetical protein